MKVVKTILSLAVLGAVAVVVVLILRQAEPRQAATPTAAAEALGGAPPRAPGDAFLDANPDDRSVGSSRHDLTDPATPEVAGPPLGDLSPEALGGRHQGSPAGDSVTSPTQRNASSSAATDPAGRWRARQGVSPPSAAPTANETPVLSTGATGTAVSSQRNQAPSQTLSRADFERRLEEADSLAARDKLEEAHLALSKLYWQGKLPPLERVQLIEKLTAWSDRLYFSRDNRLEAPYVVQSGDSLARIGQRYGVSWEFLARINGIRDPKRIRAGQRLKVVRGPFAAVVDLSDFELTVHLAGRFVRRYDVGIGKDGTTPIGTFSVQEKQPNPKYWGQPVREADDPENPLGEHWIGIGNSYGLHGTIDPASIRRRESAGCIRLLADDVAELYDLLIIGSEVRIQP